MHRNQHNTQSPIRHGNSFSKFRDSMPSEQQRTNAGDTGNPIADSIAAQYASIMNSLIEACNRLEGEKATLVTERDTAIAERDHVIAQRDAALQGEVGDVDLRSYCESCNKMWHRNYVTWFQQPFVNDAGISCSSACGACFEQVPIDHQPL
eukprot:COSAG02_NODE_4737_length_5037_cov_4.330903_3_plen_151_part_00